MKPLEQNCAIFIFQNFNSNRQSSPHFQFTHTHTALHGTFLIKWNFAQQRPSFSELKYWHFWYIFDVCSLYSLSDSLFAPENETATRVYTHQKHIDTHALQKTRDTEPWREWERKSISHINNIFSLSIFVLESMVVLYLFFSFTVFVILFPSISQRFFNRSWTNSCYLFR